MSVRLRTSIARRALCLASRVRYHSTDFNRPPKRSDTDPSHGEHIYVHTQIRTNQMVYSLQKVLKNNDALNQIPFNGKKTVPAALRKDYWTLFAHIKFPEGRGPTGLSVYQKLREYRKLHELSWDPKIMVKEDGKIASKRERGKILMDQKANTVADIAAVLAMLDTPKGKMIGMLPLVENVEGKSEGTQPNIDIFWKDLNDAEFAETWNNNIIHNEIPPKRELVDNELNTGNTDFKPNHTFNPLTPPAKRSTAPNPILRIQYLQSLRRSLRTEADSLKEIEHLQSYDAKRNAWLKEKGWSIDDFTAHIASEKKVRRGEEIAALKAKDQLSEKEKKDLEHLQNWEAKRTAWLQGQGLTEIQYRRQRDEQAKEKRATRLQELLDRPSIDATYATIDAELEKVDARKMLAAHSKQAEESSPESENPLAVKSERVEALIAALEMNIQEKKAARIPPQQIAARLERKIQRQKEERKTLESRKQNNAAFYEKQGVTREEWFRRKGRPIPEKQAYAAGL